MFRKLATSIAAFAVSLALFLGAAASPAAALDDTLPYGGNDCGTLAGPILPTELTYYRLVYRINGGQWVYSNWMATYRTSNWEHVSGAWRSQQVNFFLTPVLTPGTNVDRWAYVYRASGSGWVNLGSCSQGGIVITYR